MYFLNFVLGITCPGIQPDGPGQAVPPGPVWAGPPGTLSQVEPRTSQVAANKRQGGSTFTRVAPTVPGLPPRSTLLHRTCLHLTLLSQAGCQAYSPCLKF